MTERTGDDVEKEKEVVRENGSLRTVWKQCCRSPWVRQTQKSKESEIVMVNSEEMNAGRRPAPRGTVKQFNGSCGHNSL